jgi:hypothetical protein
MPLGAKQVRAESEVHMAAGKQIPSHSQNIEPRQQLDLTWKAAAAPEIDDLRCSTRKGSFDIFAW